MAAEALVPKCPAGAVCPKDQPPPAFQQQDGVLEQITFLGSTRVTLPLFPLPREGWVSLSRDRHPVHCSTSLTFQALVEVSESSLSQCPEDSEALRWLVLLGPQHLQVLGQRQDPLVEKSLSPSHSNTAVLLMGLLVSQDHSSSTRTLWGCPARREQAAVAGRSL